MLNGILIHTHMRVHQIENDVFQQRMTIFKKQSIIKRQSKLTHTVLGKVM